ncbi:uncharacterized protein LOC144453119 [Glandiceps talaboti]
MAAVRAAKAYILFNFFEKCPPSSPRFKTFVEEWKSLGSVVMKYCDDMISAQLHENLDPEGKYEVMSYSEYTRHDHFSMDDPPLSTPQWNEMMVGARRSGQVFHKGAFREVETLFYDELAPSIPASEDSVYFVSTYKASDHIPLKPLEIKWREWTHAHFINTRAANELQLQNLGLYKRFSRVGAFTYIVRGEFLNFKKDLKIGWDIVNKVRHSRVPCGLLLDDVSLYKIKPRNIILPKDVDSVSETLLSTDKKWLVGD